MFHADIAMVIVRIITAITLLALLALGQFKTDAGTVLAALVALTTATGAVQSTVHAKTCKGHDGKE